MVTGCGTKRRARGLNLGDDFTEGSRGSHRQEWHERDRGEVPPPDSDPEDVMPHTCCKKQSKIREPRKLLLRWPFRLPKPSCGWSCHADSCGDSGTFSVWIGSSSSITAAISCCCISPSTCRGRSSETPGPKSSSVGSEVWGGDPKQLVFFLA